MRSISLLIFTFRILFISLVVFHGTKLFPAPRRSAIRNRVTLWASKKLAAFFLQQGGIYIKAAQFLSTVSNLFDSEFTEVFARVQDRVDPRPYKQVRYRFLDEFGVEPEELFQEFDRNAIAAASLGQVHLARTRDGRKVAVKFLHPGIESQIRQDIRGIKLAISVVLWAYPYLDLRSHLYEFSTMTLTEIDYENEAENMRRVRDTFKDDARIVIPQVIDELSGNTVLTTEFIEGISVNDIVQLDRAGVHRRAAAELMVETYVKMIFDDRFYHADPHPGNLFFLPADGIHPLRIGIVDFGATLSIPERMFNVFERVYEILRRRDIPAFVDVALETGVLSPEADQEVYTNLVEVIYSRYGSFKIESFYKINPMRFGRMIKVRDLQAVGLRLRDIIAEVRLPRRYIYLGRAITLLLSLATRLDDRVNVFMSAMPHLERYLRSRARSPLWYLRSRNWQYAIKNVLSDGKVDFFKPLMHKEAPPQYQKLGQETLLVVFSVASGYFATSLYLAGHAEQALWVLPITFFSGLLFFVRVLK